METVRDVYGEMKGRGWPAECPREPAPGCAQTPLQAIPALYALIYNSKHVRDVCAAGTARAAHGGEGWCSSCPPAAGPEVTGAEALEREVSGGSDKRCRSSDPSPGPSRVPAREAPPAAAPL